MGLPGKSPTSGNELFYPSPPIVHLKKIIHEDGIRNRASSLIPPKGTCIDDAEAAAPVTRFS
jgi:hypothetical protein